jgi:transcriptional regulator with XRE-family HTH domain
MVPSDKIRAFLQQRHASQNWLSEQSGISKQAISGMLKTPGPPGYQAARAIATVMGVTTDELMDHAKSWPPETTYKVPDLKEEEMDILRLVRSIGVDLARARLLLLPDSAAAPRREEPAREERVTAHAQLPTSAHRPADARPNRGSSRNG